MSFADEYMALRAKRLAEIKETGKMQETPVEHTDPTGGGAVSDFGARYMALRQKRIADGYNALTTPPDLNVSGLRPFYDVTKDPYAEVRKIEYKAWRDSIRPSYEIRAEIDGLPDDSFVGPTKKAQLENELAAATHLEYESDYTSGNFDLSGIYNEINAVSAQIAELDELVREDEHTLANFEKIKPEISVTTEMTVREKEMRERMEANKENRRNRQNDLNILRNQYEYFLGRIFYDEKNDGNAEDVIAKGKEEHEDALKWYDAYLSNRRDYIWTLALTPEEDLSRALAPFRAEARSRFPLAVIIEGLPEEDQRTFYYLVGKGQKDLALQFANESAFDDRKELNAKTRQWAGKNFGTGLLATVGSVLTLPYAWSDPLLNEGVKSTTGLKYAGGGFGALRDNLRAGVGESLNHWSGTISEKVPVLGGKGAGDLYQLGMSIADSYMAGGLTGGAGYASTILGGSAFSSGYNHAIDKGASTETAMLQGAAQGLAEMAFEYISLDKLFNGEVTGSFIKKMFVQGGIEASEEACTSVANFFTDRWIMGGMSDYELSVQEYMKKGMTEENARSKAKWDFVENTAADAFGGLLSGGGSAGIHAGITNREISKAYGPYVGSLVAKALEIDPNNAFAQKMQKQVESGKKLSGDQLRRVVEIVGHGTEEAAFISEGQDEGTENQREETTEERLPEPDWEQYEADHAGNRFVRDGIQNESYSVEDMKQWRSDAYHAAQRYSDTELESRLGDLRYMLETIPYDDDYREVMQYHVDALELVKEERQNNNAALNEQRVEGVKYSGAEGLNDSGQRNEGVGARGSVGGLEESTGRSIPRGQGKTEKAIVEDIRGNAATQSAREIGIIGGSESADLRVIPTERIGESESWSRIRDEVEAKGQKLVLVVGKMETVDPVTKQVYTHEGIRQVNADGTVTYYIKADKITRNAEQIYKHEDFHDIVHNNPEILGDLVLALEMEYGRQEILRMVNRYVEAFDGIYGRIEDTMTEEQENALIMVYMEEVFADVYGDIRRGKIETASAQKIMRDQTDRVQRAAQNRKATETKTAPPIQSFSIANTSKLSLKEQLSRYYKNEMLSSDSFYFGNTPTELEASGLPPDPLVWTISDFKKSTKEKHNVPRRSIKDLHKNFSDAILAFGKDGRVGIVTKDIDADGKPLIVAIHSGVRVDNRSVNAIKSAYGLDNPAEWINNQFAAGKNLVLYDKKRADAFLRSYGYEASQEDGVYSLRQIITHDKDKVKQNFSIDDSKLALEDRVSGDDYLNALDLIEEIESVGARVDSYGYVTLYHRTSDAAAKTIYRTGVMTAKEDGLFFSTNASGANNYAYGDSVVELKVPAEMLVLDDIFADEASIRIPLEGRRRMNVSEYLVRKGNAETQKFSVDDEAYLSAVEDGDMEMAQRMVDEAAKKAGFSVRAYHRTPNGTFHEFRNWQYFTEDREYAETYQNQSASVNYKKTATKPRTYDVFLKPGKAFDTRQARERKIFETQFYRQWGNGAPLSDRGLPDWTDGDDFVEFFEEEGYDYTAILLDEGGTGGYGEEVKDRGISYVIKSSEQIKSADPVTYDDNGNVIPLSQRFNQNKTDIRYSVDDEARELDEEYARKITEGEEPRRGKTEPEWEAVRGSMDDYNATAKELKKQRAEKNSITVLKNRITKNEQMLRELSNMRTMAKKSNFLSMNMDKEIERRRGIIQETLEIDRAALKAKQEAKKQEDKSRKKKEQEEEIRQVKAQKATEDMVTEVMDLFFTKKGVRYEVREILYELADQTVKDGRITDEIRDELLRVLYENSEVIIEPDGSSKDIRKFVQYAKIYVPEDVRTAFGEEWDSFRNAAFGNRIYFTSNSNDMSIDSAMEELEKVFGSIAPEGATLKERLERILDLAEEGKAEKISLREMMERNSEEGQSVEDQMDEMERKLDQILLTFSEKAGFEIDIRQKTLRKLNKQREEFRRTLERQRDRVMENELMNQVRKRAQRLKAYYKRATPSVRRMIDEQIGDLDTLARSISQKGLEDIQQIIDSYNQTAAELGEAFIANPEIVARLERVKQRHLDDMTVEEVRTLGEALTGIIQQIQNYNKMVSEERHLLITDMANRAQKEIVESEGTKKTGYLRKFMMGQLNAKVFFGKISGYADGAWKWITDRLNHGEEMERQYQQRAMALFDPFLSDKKNQEWLKKASGKNAVWETVSVKGSLALEDGAAVGSVDSIELTPMMKVSLLMHSKNDDNLRHIGYYEKSGDVYGLMGGGVTIPDKALYKKGDLKEAYARGQVLVIPPDVVRTIAKNCTEQEKAFAALLTKYFDGMAKSAINEVSLQVDGWERAVVVNYFPIQSDKAFIVSENGLLVQDMSLRGSPFLKERSHKGKNPMFLFDATDVLYRNIEQVSKYYGLTRPLRDLHAVMNATYYQTERKTVDGTSENELLRKVKEQEGWGKVSVGSVEKALISKWGHDAKTYIEKLSAHLQGAKSEGSALDDWLSGLRGLYARSVISFNPSSVAKQISSYFVAYAYLDAGDLTKGLLTAKYGGNIKEAVMNLSKYSAVYWYRNQGNVNAEIREYTERKGTLERLPLGFRWTQMMDSAVTRRLLAACMHHVSKYMGLQPGSQESIDAGTDRYWSEVAKLFNKVVLDTQSNTSTMERPDIVRGDKNSVAKFITMFRTDAFQQHNLQVEARGMRRAAKKAYEANQTEANKKRLQAANKHLAKTTAAVFMGQLTVGLITSLLAYLSFRDKDYYDEEGEFSWKKFLGDVVVNTAEGYAGMILGLDWIASLVESKIAEEKWYGPEVLGLESVKTFCEDVVTFFKAAVALDFQEGKKQLRKLAKSAGFVFGIPVSNIEKYILMVTRWFAPEFAERWENIWEETEIGDLQYRAPGVMEEAISVILDNRVDNLSDDDKAEIARLYIAGGTGAVPSAIPTSFSFTNEDGEEVTVTLSPKQKEQYREIWNEYAGAGLADILASEQYESADDKGKTEYIDKLYKFAGQMAKNAVEPKKEPEKWVQQGLDAKKNGVSLGEYVIFRVDLTGVSGKNEEGETVDGLKMQRSMELIEAMGWSDQQEESVWLDVVASDSVGAATKALTDAGVPWDIVNNLVVMPGGKTEKLVAIGEAKLNDQVKVKAMSVYAGDLEKKMLSVGLKYGVKPEWYTEVLKNANADSKGGISQSEAREYILGMGLSLQDMAVLFQMVTDAKEGKSNPFYPSYAELFWYDVHEDDPD